MNRKQRRAEKDGKPPAVTVRGGKTNAASLDQAIGRYRAGDHAKAASLCRAIVATGKADATCYHLLGVVEGTLGHADAAATALARACALAPDNAEMQVNLGLIEVARGNKDRAAAAYRAALAIDPRSASAHNNLGGILMDQGAADDAAAHFRAAIAAKPDFATAHANLAATLIRMNRLDEAIPELREAARLEPALAKAHCNLGFALRRKGFVDEAIASFRHATELRADYPEALTGLAICFALHTETGQALPLLKRALEIKPDYPDAAGQYLHELRLVCDWPEAERWKAVVDRANRAAIDAGERPPETAFGHMIGNMDPAMNLRIAKGAADEMARLMAAQAAPFVHERKDDPARRLRIGYISSDLRDHAVGQLTRRLFGLHDRAGFEIVCYSAGREDDSAIRRQIVAEADRFVDIRGEELVATSRRIRADGIDILVDLNGWTAGNRLEVLALRPAPIQATWLGYAGTTGADLIDYVIVDPVIAPVEDQAYFSERLCRLPHCYMMADDRQAIAAEPVDRARYGLPEDGVVFCSFNNGYKIEPAVFGAWMTILRAVSGSVLWLPGLSDAIRVNLHRAADAACVDPSRLIFADRPAKDLHLKRLGLADLGLDTMVYNGHSTTADTLWAGVPVLTVRGGHFASRVTASLLTALDLADCILPDLDAYASTAIALAQYPARRAALRARLAQNRITQPLFQTHRFVRNLERAYRAMWQRHATGQVPATLTIAPD
ncbi:MAG: tetratricopeptide repeat protein [Rhodospirillaceae bacterium]|nr:tetratricopeptide repeat protein [Rhodospirillaceae bacterium]